MDKITKECIFLNFKGKVIRHEMYGEILTFKFNDIFLCVNIFFNSACSIHMHQLKKIYIFCGTFTVI